MIKTIMVVLPIPMLGLVPIAMPHPYYYNWGDKIGAEDGKEGLSRHDAGPHDADAYCAREGGETSQQAGYNMTGKASYT